jgi:hypothetical protein
MKRRNILAVSVAGGIALLGGAAAAVALPGAASPTAGDHLSQHSVTVPDPNAHADGHSDGVGAAASPDTGSAISELATTTDSTGVDKGAEISAVASGDHSQAGQHGTSDAAPDVTSAPISTPPVAAPPVSTPPVSGGPPAATPPFDVPPVSTPPLPTPPVSVPHGPLS